MTIDLFNFTRDSLAERPGGLWDCISPSRLSLWSRCPLAFKLKYIDGIEPKVTPGLFTGRMVHYALERWYRHRQLGLPLAPAELIDWVEEHWTAVGAADKVVYSSHDEEEQTCDQALRLVQAYLRHIPQDESQPLLVETALTAPLVDPVTGEDLGLPLVGIVDLALDEPDGPLIVDYKTAARGGDLIEMTHEIQLSAYARLFRHTHRRQEAGVEIRRLIKTKAPKIEQHRFSSRSGRAFRRLFALARDYLDALDRGHFGIRPSLACTMCEHRDNLCRDWEG
jgi:hypothetical protein